MGVSKLRPHHLCHVLCVVLGAGLAACDMCEPVPDRPGNQSPVDLEICPPLPGGIERIEGLVSVRAHDRFDGLVLTLSDRALACGEPAAQHGYCSGGEGLTIGFSEQEAVPGVHPLEYPLFLEFETPDTLSVGGSLRGASVELFEVTDSCVTGRLVGVVAGGGPFDGGFQAPRCAP